MYVFASEREYSHLKSAIVISKESFLIKPNSWEGFLALADLMMASAQAKADEVPASPTDAKPEVHAEGGLRMHR